MALSEPYLGETKVLHYLEVLRDVVGFDKIKEKVVNPLKGRKIGAYYGCMLLRPSTTMQFDDPENPTIIEDFIKALGATPVVYPMRNECCGGYISLKEKKMASNMVDQIMATIINAKIPVQEHLRMMFLYCKKSTVLSTQDCGFFIYFQN